MRYPSRSLSWARALSWALGALFSLFITPAGAETLAVEGAKAQPPAWSELQMIGPADVPQPADDGRAWASRFADSGEEWVKLTYAQPIAIQEIRVYENLNPGAISKVIALNDFGEATLWAGEDTTKTSPFVVKAAGVKARQIKIELVTTRVPGWNEIDAVEIIDVQGQSHWAIDAQASSSYAQVSSGGDADGDLFSELVEKQLQVHLVSGTIVGGRLLKIREGFLELDTPSGRRLVARQFIQMIELP
ncbi:hypothetical protein KKF91_13910 [Myxococcota bacterium]|nr:hypothetical protein [Myxococcota bacterium]MBU1431634.1 hypothetical protein [Myxococcota bacterium]MBU1896788.1 hypothetical protein [Myxococcota bacterium]